VSQDGSKEFQVGGSVLPYILCGGVILYEEARVETIGSYGLTWPVIVAPDYASVVSFEVKLEDVSNVGSGVCWVKEGCLGGGLDDYYFGGSKVWTCQDEDDQ
jgi:hypothetical protein